jgi:threonine synthase
MFYFRCRKTGREYDIKEPRWQSEDGGLLDIIREKPLQSLDLQGDRPGLWKYRNAIPLEKDENILSFGEEKTPLIPFQYAGRDIWAKLEYFFVTGSFKDRGAAVLISKIKELGIERVVEDSSGNAGGSIAAYCAAAGIGCDIYVSEQASPAKLTQIAAYGARIHKIPGSRTNVTKAVMEAAKKQFYASHYWNPFFFEGTKTLAFELWEQLKGNVPDTLVLQAGHGTLIIGAWKGFTELKEAGLINKIPRIIAVQPVMCSPLYNRFYSVTDAQECVSGKTITEGIDIADPPRLDQLCDILKETGGGVIRVEDASVVKAMISAARKGLYIEPAAASVFAAVEQLQTKPDEKVVVTLTGHGLKATHRFQELL